MYAYALNAIPSQSFTTTQDGDRYQIRIIETNGCMSADVTKNGIVLFTGMRIKNGLPVIPFKYLMNGGGNFLFICVTEDEVYYDQFGITQTLYYFSAAEMAAL